MSALAVTSVSQITLNHFIISKHVAEIPTEYFDVRPFATSKGSIDPHYVSYVELPTQRKSGAGVGLTLDDSDTESGESTPRKRRRGRAGYKDDNNPKYQGSDSKNDRKPPPGSGGANAVDDDDNMDDSSRFFSGLFG